MIRATRGVASGACYRSVDGSKVYKAWRDKYAGEGYDEGDILGFYISLPQGELYEPKQPDLVKYKGMPFHAQGLKDEKKTPDPVPGVAASPRQLRQEDAVAKEAAIPQPHDGVLDFLDALVVRDFPDRPPPLHRLRFPLLPLRSSPSVSKLIGTKIAGQQELLQKYDLKDKKT
ncbi:protein TRAUCO-like [Hordeum vulgare]|nr:protein TRAUCO-like [Hordeum vulgare]